MRARILALAAGLIAVLLIVVIVSTRGSGDPGYSTDVVRVNGTREADGVPLILEGDLYLPNHTGNPADAAQRSPAVLLAHGWGGSKDSLAAEAKELVGQGFVVLAYSARGFGGSGGKTHLDSPDYEVKDAQLMLDYLSKRPEVELDKPGDPRVGVAGESYGGALALLLAGTDPRVDAVVPQITWNDLRQALFPQFATTGTQTTPAMLTPIGTPGVFKKQWTALLISAGASAGGPDPNVPIPAYTTQPAPAASALATPSATPSAGATPSTSIPAASGTTATPAPSSSAAPNALQLQTLTQACGRLDTTLCLGYIQAATTGRPPKELLALLKASSPARVASKITAPTLLIQGEADSLFPLSEGDANARAIASNGTSVQVMWTSGGHDGGTPETGRITSLTEAFFKRVLGTPPGQSAPPAQKGDSSTSWLVSVPDAAISSTQLDPVTQRRTAAAYPGLLGGDGAVPLKQTVYPLGGGEQLAVSPPGATPATLTSLPGASSALGLLGGLTQGSSSGSSDSGSSDSGSGDSGSSDSGSGDSSLSGGSGGSSSGSSGLAAAGLGQVPGQSAQFDTPPLTASTTITGSSRVTVTISSTAADATVFASLVDVAPGGGTTLPEQLVSPVRLDQVPAAGQTVTIALPAIVHDVPAGHRLRVVISSTDQGYALPDDARGYQIKLAGDSKLTVPEVPLLAENNDAVRSLIRPAVILAILIALLVLAFVFWGRRRKRADLTGADEELIGVPLAVVNLGKAYGDGFRAVTDLSFRVETGQVLGLLGPNGAGKTTTLRMLMGLIHPSEGEIRVFGHKITPGAPVLSRLGSFIEGPGFLPHLSGIDNLQLYWRATGRPEADAQFAIALEIAGLGEDVKRKVRTYSQGMRQRLAIAQAMLGLPDLLVLDEPTNGLDPPQIRQMRAVLQRYAQTSRTVIVSSHLLAEVEQTCTHLVVMSDGKLVAQGTTAELVGASNLTALDVSVPGRAASIAKTIDGVSGVDVTPTGITVHADAPARGDLVRTLVLAGVRVDRVAPQRGLEDTFLALVGRAED